MKALAAIRPDRHQSPGAVSQSAPSTLKVADAIDRGEIGHRFSVRLWLAEHRVVGPSKEETLSRSITSSIHDLSPIRGRWAFLTRAEKSSASWANQGLTVSLTRDRTKSGH
jgi:hypothetical protein